jgi:CHAT domain-containing protein
VAVVITGDQLQLVRFPESSRTRVTQLVDDLLTCIDQGDPYSLSAEYIDTYRARSQQVFEMWLAPCLQAVPDAKHICILPCDILSYLPFHALMTPEGKFAIQEYDVAYASSARALVLSRAAVAAQQWGELPQVLFVDPRQQTIVGGDSFAEGIQNHLRPMELKASALSGSQAARKELASAITDADIFHFLGNTELACYLPSRSGLLLADDEGRVYDRFTAADIGTLSLPHCRLVVLANTTRAAGKLHQGDDLHVISRAFLQAGAPTTLLSLWRQPEQDALQLWTRFYERTLQEATPSTPTAQWSAAVRQWLDEAPQPFVHPRRWAGWFPLGG